MDFFFQAVAAVLLTVLVGMTLDGHARSSAVMLGIAVCVMILAGTISFLKPVVDFLEELQDTSGLRNETVAILMKTAGICAVTEISSLICEDSGNASLGKAVTFLANVIILWMSLPLFTVLLELMHSLLGNL